MVNIRRQQESTTCDISKKNILRSDSCDQLTDSNADMGSQHGHLLQEMQQGAEALQEMDDAKVKRYTKPAILALRNASQSKAKPKCADDRPFWIDGKPVPPSNTAPRASKKSDRRIGSGRLSSGSDKFNPPAVIPTQQHQQFNDHHPPPYNNNNNNYYREKTGREFCDNMNEKGGNGEYKVSFFNPVNRDHRRLLREKSEENLPEWVNAGPKSRFDTIDLHGFHDDKSRHESSSSSFGSKGSDGENKENREKFGGKTFSFDEFLGSQMNGGVEYVPDSYQPYHNQYNSNNNRQQHGQASRFKRYFNPPNHKNRDYHFSHPPPHQQAPPGFPPIQQNFHTSNSNNPRHFQSKFDANNNEAATALLELLHRQQNSFDHFKQQPPPPPQFNKNNSGMPSATDLESIWRHGNAERQRQFEHNKAMLAGKSIVDVIDVLTQSQLRANAMPFNNASTQQPWNQNWQQNQYGGFNPMKNNNNNNQMNKYQMARVLERQMMVQGQNPMYGGLTPQDPEYWDKIRQQQQAFYQQYERNAATRQVKAKFPGHQRRVKFDAPNINNNNNNMTDKPKLENFFKNHQNVGDLPQIDPEKAIKVEEFERKIKQVAASCGKPEQQIK